MVINEVLARNIEAVDHNGTNPDMIELYYDGPAPLNLADMSITDDPDNRRKFVFPGGTTIDAGEYLVLYADDNTTTSGIHLGFALDGNGEGVYLYNRPASGGGLLDSVEFGMQLGVLSIGRVGYDGLWKLTQPTFGTANIAQRLGNPATLKLNEWLADGNIFRSSDFIEIYNPDPLPVDMGGLFLTDDPVVRPGRHQIAPLSFVPGAAYVVFIADGDEESGPDHLNFRLSPDQEILGLFDAELYEIDKVIYGPQTTNASQGRAPDGEDTYEFSDSPTPGVSNIDTIVINEVLAHSHLAPDWIELYNTTDTAIDIGGWFLSDNSSKRKKYRIPDGTMIDGSGPNKYLVFYEDVHFGDGNNPDCNTPFALSENGEMVCLSSGLDGVLTGYYKEQDFGASETGVSFGRYLKSTGMYDFVSMDHNTPGELNGPPEVGPIVINEIMYHPDWPDSGSYNNEDYEYIELYNITAQPVTLYDFVEDEPWKFTDGIDFTFPASPPVAIPGGGYLLVVKNRAAFMWRYPAIPVDKILGPYDGQMRNSGEGVEISKSGDVDRSGTRYYVRVDRVNYSDGWHPEDCPDGIDLWPEEADGGGKSLTRIDPNLYGNDVINWRADDPSPGVSTP
ncbi:MAG: lamin tail domain-containing protein [Planctomycetota bacterium]